jgi:hypothetical protein
LNTSKVIRYKIGAVLLSDLIISAMIRELRKLKDGIKVDPEEIFDPLERYVIKREVLNSAIAKEAQKLVAKVFKQQERAKAKLKEKSSD